jgi:hypothetical protein
VFSIRGSSVYEVLGVLVTRRCSYRYFLFYNAVARSCGVRVK